jgi:hypothetical protein
VCQVDLLGRKLPRMWITSGPSQIRSEIHEDFLSSPLLLSSNRVDLPP